MKESDVQFSSGALSKYAELQIRQFAESENAQGIFLLTCFVFIMMLILTGVGFEGFVKLYEAILADPEVFFFFS